MSENFEWNCVVWICVGEGDYLNAEILHNVKKYIYILHRNKDILGQEEWYSRFTLTLLTALLYPVGMLLCRKKVPWLSEYGHTRRSSWTYGAASQSSCFAGLPPLPV